MKKLLIAIIKFYQKYISPAFPRRCCFIPTCSQYAVEALEKHGVFKGGWLTLKRLLRCHPFHSSKHDFYDPVP